MMSTLLTDIVGGTVAGVAVVLITFIARQVWKISKFDRQRESDHAEVLRRLDGQDEKLDNIEHETHMNSGTSLKDAVMRTESTALATAATLEAHIRDAKYQQGKIDAFFLQMSNGTPPVVTVTTTPPA